MPDRSAIHERVTGPMKNAPATASRAGSQDSAQEEAFSPWSAGAWIRLAWAILSFVAVESIIFGLSVLPAVWLYEWHLDWDIEPHWLRTVVLAMAILPAYFVFAIAFMALSAVSTQLHGWRSPERAELRISELDWPLLAWGRYMMSIHLVRILAGTFLRTTPIWCWYMRLNGARLGRRVFVNSLAVTDHNLLDFGDDVVIGDAVHLSGHTVERGLVKTRRVRLGAGTTVGVGAIVEIGVETGPACQIGALAVVPKYMSLDGHSTYVGIPVHKLEPGPGDAGSHGAAGDRA
jgi:acetyltransferase-like isoleucine patch superfamily enzyme